MNQGLPEVSEECLNLNIWTPDPNAKGLPVMVFAHGGGQVNGSGSSPISVGTHMAKEGVVLVTNNRRLGVEGFMYLGEFFDDERGLGNFGILDQITALEWVQENIEQFGGDPNNVTLFGESGGAAASAATIADQGSQGLVNRAILQSGGHAVHSQANAGAITREILKRLDIKPGDFDAIVQTPWSNYTAIYGELNLLEICRPQVFLPVIGGSMPIHPVDQTHAGQSNDIDLMIGTCRDEASLFASLLPTMQDSPFHKRAKRVIEASGNSWESVLKAYREARPHKSDTELEAAMMGDMWFRVPSLRLAEGQASKSPGRTYMYLFTWESPNAGAAHALDLMLFGNGIPFEPLVGNAPHQNTEQTMRRCWTNFAKTGDPSIEGLQWPVYDTKDRLTMELNEECKVLTDPYAIERPSLGGALENSWSELGL